MSVKVDVEFCGSCGYASHFKEMSSHIRNLVPDADITSSEGRRGSFEVTVNGVLVHSKLTTMAFPDFDNVADIVKEVAEGRDVQPVSKQQPINCIIL